MSADGIDMDGRKVQAVQDWPEPRTTYDIMQVRRGLHHLQPKIHLVPASITVPLYEPLKMKTPFV